MKPLIISVFLMFSSLTLASEYNCSIYAINDGNKIISGDIAGERPCANFTFDSELEYRDKQWRERILKGCNALTVGITSISKADGTQKIMILLKKKWGISATFFNVNEIPEKFELYAMPELHTPASAGPNLHTFIECRRN